jgi:hypothetical protein
VVPHHKTANRGIRMPSVPILSASLTALLGSASICFSIGCVCKVSWVLAQLNRRRTAAEQQLEHLVLH